MLKNYLFIILIISAVFISGCTSENQTANKTNETSNASISTGTPNTQSPECNALWWFDNTNRVCRQKQFCGLYMYFGLQTFETKEACEAALAETTDPYYNLQADNKLLEDTLAANSLYNVKFLYKFPVAKMPMLYYIYNDTPIDSRAYETTMKQIPFAFDAWERASLSKLKFIKSETPVTNGITIKIVDNRADEKLSYDDLVEAQANTIIFANYTLITGGTLTTEAYKNSYQARTVAMHGIGHILGFDNCGTTVSIMHEPFLPGGDVQQKATTDLIETMKILYMNVPASS